MRDPIPLQVIALASVLGAWVTLGFVLASRARRSAGQHQRRDATSLLGMALQGVGFALVFSVHNRWPAFNAATLVRTVLSVVLASVAAFVIAFAIRTLGKQWSLTARVLENHQLITVGPYAFVRHPIYSGFLALLLATGVAKSYILTTLVAAVVYVIGTQLRTSREERLLREAFGPEYEAYAKRVPALLPRGRTGA